MKKLCICIPTYNRAQCINYLLEKSFPSLMDYSVDFYVTDSSENDSTARVVSSYLEKYGERLIYEHIPDYPDKTTDLKVVKAFEVLQDSYEYILLFGDGFVPDIPAMWKLICPYMQDEYDVIHFYKDIESSKTFDNGLSFAYECAWYATYYGMTVVSTKLIRKIQYRQYLQKDRNTGYLYWKGLLTGIASDQMKIVVIDQIPMDSNPYKPTNSSYRPGRFLNFWVINWPQMVDSLPSYYEEIKPKIKKDVGNKLGMYTRGNLIVLRLSENLEYKEVIRNKTYFGQVTDTPFWLIKAISLTPIPLLRLLKGIKKIMKKRGNIE